MLVSSCNEIETKDEYTNNKDSISPAITEYDTLRNIDIQWLDSAKVNYNIDTSLSHIGAGFSFDSAITVEYTGYWVEDIFLPINDKGQWISNITKRKKLTLSQLDLIHSIFGSRKAFNNPQVIPCYEPRHGIIYFKDNKVICQSAICIDCARLQSTAKLGDGTNYSSFNQKTQKQLEQLCIDLEFSECNQ